MHLLLTSIFCVTAVWAIATDFRYRRISNRLTVGTALLGLAVRAALGGAPAAVLGLEGLLVGLLALFLPFALGWMGAGDVKLLAALGALGGPSFVLQAAVAGCVVGGLMSIVYLAQERRLWSTIQALPIFIIHPFTWVTPAGRRMPFGPALVLGGAATMVMAHSPL